MVGIGVVLMVSAYLLHRRPGPSILIAVFWLMLFFELMVLFLASIVLLMCVMRLFFGFFVF